MEALKQALKISKTQETFTKRIHKPKHYNSVKDNVLLVENFNFQLDLLFLPETKQGFKYCAVIVDLADDEFDIEPLKNKNPDDIIKAIEKIKKRKFVKLKNNAGQTVATDSGTEFKGAFGKYLFDHSIFHKIAQPNRHIQIANVERLNGILGGLFNGYMNNKEEETGKVYKEWTNAVPVIRDQLNAIRKKELPDNIYTYEYPTWNPEKIKSVKSKDDITMIEPKYKVGDLVYVALETPEDSLGKKLHGGFRNGDSRLTKEPHSVTKVLYFHGPPYYRYIINTFKGVSYQEDELRPAAETEEEYKVKEIIGKKKEKNLIFYLIWWKGYLKKDASWEPRKELMKDIPKMISDYEVGNQGSPTTPPI